MEAVSKSLNRISECFNLRCISPQTVNYKKFLEEEMKTVRRRRRTSSGGHPIIAYVHLKKQKSRRVEKVSPIDFVGGVFPNAEANDLLIHWSPLVSAAFCPKKVDLTRVLTLNPGYDSV